MNFLRSALMSLSGTAFAVSVAAGQSASPVPLNEGQLQLRLVGNGKICARLHEEEVVERISPDRTPTKLFTTYGYIFRVTAMRQGPRPQLFNLLDTGPVKTWTRQEMEKPPRTVNPRPDYAMHERMQPHRDVWMRHAACKSFPRFKQFDLPQGDYVLKLEYRAQAPNGTWFPVFEQESAVVEIRPRQVTETRVRFLDDGNRREIFFFQPAESQEIPADPDDSSETGLTEAGSGGYE